jgi:hypothetical protein
MKWIASFCCGAALAGFAAAQTGELPGLASGMLQQVQAARQAVAAHDATAARIHVDQALANATAALNQAVAQGRPTAVPFYATIDETVTYSPVKHGNGGELTANRMKRDTNVRDATAQTTRDYVDVAVARDRLQATQTALLDNNLQAADMDLAAIQSGIIHRTTVETDLPLLRAREDLLLARNRALDGQYKDAEAPLRSAGDALAEYARLNPGPHGTRALEMRQSMDDYAHIIHHDHSDALDRINGWLGTTDRWYRDMSQ